MNSPDHISESLETIFWVKIHTNSFMRIRDPGWKTSDPRSGINISDPQHCIYRCHPETYCKCLVAYGMYVFRIRILGSVILNYGSGARDSIYSGVRIRILPVIVVAVAKIWFVVNH
jgi:hypothetical protein